MKKSLLAALAVFLGLQPLLGVVPKSWDIYRLEDFLKGKFTGISVSSDGRLRLAPQEDRVEGPAEEFYLSLLAAEDGTLYLGTGHGGKIYRIPPKGVPELYFQVPEMDIYCLALNKSGELFAGTSPNGKIYKITDKAKGDVFFNPDEKYIWDLLFTSRGTLLAAVGESGGIYEINAQGEGDSILEAEENHILCLKSDKNEDILAGSGGKGHLYRITSGNKATIVFESPFEEIRTIALDGAGNVYAAAGGTAPLPSKGDLGPVLIKTETDISITVKPSAAESASLVAGSQKQPGALYRIDTTGTAKRLWHSAENLIYTLVWDRQGKRILFGTGDTGRLFALDADDKVLLLLQKDVEQVYSLLPIDSRFYVLSNNPSGLSLLQPDQRMSGEYISDILDAEFFSSWGIVRWQASVPKDSTLHFLTRSGNTKEAGRTWSDWSPPYQKSEGEPILSPKARYLQFKAVFRSTSGKATPELDRAMFYYQQANLEPLIVQLELLEPNEVFLKPPEQDDVIWGAADPSAGRSGDRDSQISLAVAKKVVRKGFQTVIWQASDPNGDDMAYSISIRAGNETRWRLLEKEWKESLFAFDTVSIPDGEYVIKVEATDRPSNPGGTELGTEKTSRPLVVDNSMPVIAGLQAVRDKNILTVTFSAEDSLSPLTEAAFLIRPGDWKPVFPLDGIGDSLRESYRISYRIPPDADDLITVRVKDSRGNVAVARTAF